MIVFKRNEPHLIVISTESTTRMIERFPNQLIWDINSYLKNRYSLYEFYYLRNKRLERSVRVTGVVANKYLAFKELDITYIENTVEDESECQSEHIKYRDEVQNYENFFEMYSMEAINELNYMAVDNLHDTMVDLDVLLNKSLFTSKRKAKSLLCRLVPVCIFIGDHDYMEIHVCNARLREDLLKIINKYT